MDKIALIFKALSDKTRLRIISVLASAGCELCVCEIVDSLQEPQYKISKHLKELRFAGLVRETKQGKWVSYRMETFQDRFKKFLLKAIVSIPDETIVKDKERSNARLSLRKNGQCVIGLASKQWKLMAKELRRKAINV